MRFFKVFHYGLFLLYSIFLFIFITFIESNFFWDLTFFKYHFCSDLFERKFAKQKSFRAKIKAKPKWDTYFNLHSTHFKTMHIFHQNTQVHTKVEECWLIKPLTPLCSAQLCIAPLIVMEVWVAMFPKEGLKINVKLRAVDCLG